MEFNSSQTKINLMRAFAGESQARNRYTFASDEAKNQNLYVISEIFTFTANQEKAHAKVFWDLMKEISGENVQIDGSYPVEVTNDIIKLLRSSVHNEFEEHSPVYPAFAKIATEEGFTKVANAFNKIAEVEKTHGERYQYFADLLEQGKLFVSDVSTKWICLNCGYIQEGTQAPNICPVCSHPQGYFVRLELAPYSNIQFLNN